MTNDKSHILPYGTFAAMCRMCRGFLENCRKHNVLFSDRLHKLTAVTALHSKNVLRAQNEVCIGNFMKQHRKLPYLPQNAGRLEVRS